MTPAQMEQVLEVMAGLTPVPKENVDGPFHSTGADTVPVPPGFEPTPVAGALAKGEPEHLLAAPLQGGPGPNAVGIPGDWVGYL